MTCSQRHRERGEIDTHIHTQPPYPSGSESEKVKCGRCKRDCVNELCGVKTSVVSSATPSSLTQTLPKQRNTANNTTADRNTLSKRRQTVTQHTRNTQHSHTHTHLFRTAAIPGIKVRRQHDLSAAFRRKRTVHRKHRKFSSFGVKNGSQKCGRRNEEFDGVVRGEKQLFAHESSFSPYP